MRLTEEERGALGGARGDGARMAMEIVAEAARMLGAPALLPVASAHVDSCVHVGDSGTLFCERLVDGGARVGVPSTTNVGALNLLRPDQCRLTPERRRMAARLMRAHERMGCRPSWTCAPYQAGARPALGAQVAWGESNAVAFANTVLGARTNRYGDFLDIACAIAGRAPACGLHLEENRRARIVIDLSGLPEAVMADPAFFPVLGALAGRIAGDAVCAIVGAPAASEDDLKALCAAAASTGAVALLHVVGSTPEAPDLAAALGGGAPEETVRVDAAMLGEARRALSQAPDGPIDSVALGSPHYSAEQCRALLRLAGGRPFSVPVRVCTGRHVVEALEERGALEALGVVFVVDTCVVVSPILPEGPGVMMTDSAKFAHYAAGNTGHLPVFGTLAECVASARAGRVVRLPA